MIRRNATNNTFPLLLHFTLINQANHVFKAIPIGFAGAFVVIRHLVGL
jgi:hypothetical protein